MAEFFDAPKDPRAHAFLRQVLLPQCLFDRFREQARSHIGFVIDTYPLWEWACPRRSHLGPLRTVAFTSPQTLNLPTSICRCVPNRASSTLDAAVSSLAAEVCSETSRTFSTLRLISSATALCCSAAAAICWFID